MALSLHAWYGSSHLPQSKLRPATSIGVTTGSVTLDEQKHVLAVTLNSSCASCCRVEPAQLRSALQALARLAADPQLLVDFFVNYDCDLQVPAGAVLGLRAYQS